MSVTAATPRRRDAATCGAAEPVRSPGGRRGPGASASTAAQRTRPHRQCGRRAAAAAALPGPALRRGAGPRAVRAAAGAGRPTGRGRQSPSLADGLFSGELQRQVQPQCCRINLESSVLDTAESAQSRRRPAAGSLAAAPGCGDDRAIRSSRFRCAATAGAGPAAALMRRSMRRSLRLQPPNAAPSMAECATAPGKTWPGGPDRGWPGAEPRPGRPGAPSDCGHRGVTRRRRLQPLPGVRPHVTRAPALCPIIQLGRWRLYKTLKTHMHGSGETHTAWVSP